MEIKLRVWDGTRMRYDNMYGEVMVISMDGKVMCSWRADNENFILKKPDAVPMLWTGLKDTNGKDIYDGDVVEYTSPFGHRKRVYVTYYDSEASWGLNRSSGHPAYWTLKEMVACSMWLTAKVIGNVYENPEMVGGNNAKD